MLGAKPRGKRKDKLTERTAHSVTTCQIKAPQNLPGLPLMGLCPVVSPFAKRNIRTRQQIRPSRRSICFGAWSRRRGADDDPSCDVCQNGSASKRGRATPTITNAKSIVHFGSGSGGDARMTVFVRPVGETDEGSRRRRRSRKDTERCKLECVRNCTKCDIGSNVISGRQRVAAGMRSVRVVPRCVVYRRRSVTLICVIE